MGYENYLRISRDQVKLWMHQIIAGVDNQQTHHFLEEPGYTWTVWGLAQAANSHFDFSSGDAEPEIVDLAREVLGPEAPEGSPDEEEGWESQDHPQQGKVQPATSMSATTARIERGGRHLIVDIPKDNEDLREKVRSLNGYVWIGPMQENRALFSVPLDQEDALLAILSRYCTVEWKEDGESQGHTSP